MKKVEISLDDASRGIFRVNVRPFEDADAQALVDLNDKVNEILKKYGLETRFAHITGEVKEDAQKNVPKA